MLRRKRKKSAIVCFDFEKNTQRTIEILEALIKQSYPNLSISWKAGHIGSSPVFYFDLNKLTKSQKKVFLADLTLNWSRAGFSIVERKKDPSLKGFKDLRIKLQRFC